MAIVNFIGLVVGLISSIYGTIQFYEWLMSGRKRQEETGPPTPIKHTGETDRVVLRFNKSNIQKEGTLEYMIMSFYQKLPYSYRAVMVASPGSLEALVSYHLSSSGAALFMCLFVILAPVQLALFQSEYIRTNWDWTNYALGALIIGATCVGLRGALYHFRKHWRAKKVIEEYTKFFRNNDLRIDLSLLNQKECMKRQSIRRVVPSLIIVRFPTGPSCMSRERCRIRHSPYVGAAVRLDGVNSASGKFRQLCVCGLCFFRLGRF
jgi:hypothetical protein